MPRRMIVLSSRLGGFALISAIFILVVLAALVTYLVSLSTTESATSVMDLRGSQTYWAARSALDSTARNVLAPEDENGATVFQDCPAVPLAVALPAFVGYTVQITGCERAPAVSGSYYTDHGRNIVIYRLTATASVGGAGSNGYVERQVTGTFTKCKDPNAALDDGTTVDPRNRC